MPNKNRINPDRYRFRWLGTLLVMGVSQGSSDKIIAGAIGVSAFAPAANALAVALEARATRAVRGGH